MNLLADKHCREYSTTETALSLVEIDKFQVYTPDWLYHPSSTCLIASFNFNDYHQTIEFVNRVADIAETENHHPEMLVTYKLCKVSYSTHTVNGITENDFICAAKIDLIYLEETSA